MKSLWKKALDIKHSLNKQVVVIALLPVIIVTCIFTYVFIANTQSRGEARIKVYREALLS